VEGDERIDDRRAIEEPVEVAGVERDDEVVDPDTSAALVKET
jgi:hypothetical protein